jgi:hypothetical protein
MVSWSLLTAGLLQQGLRPVGADLGQDLADADVDDALATAIRDLTAGSVDDLDSILGELLQVLRCDFEPELVLPPLVALLKHGLNYVEQEHRGLLLPPLPEQDRRAPEGGVCLDTHLFARREGTVPKHFGIGPRLYLPAAIAGSPEA